MVSKKMFYISKLDQSKRQRQINPPTGHVRGSILLISSKALCQPFLLPSFNVYYSWCLCFYHFFPLSLFCSKIAPTKYNQFKRPRLLFLCTIASTFQKLTERNLENVEYRLHTGPRALSHEAVFTRWLLQSKIYQPSQRLLCPGV